MVNAVGKDKDNKTIEIMLTSVSPLDMFLGKLLGYGAASLLQMFAWLGAAVIILNLGGQSLSFLQGFSIPTSVIVMGIPYFIPGFFLYGSLMAGVGALAPNLREANNSTFIITMPLVFLFLIINQLIGSPNSFISVFLSIFPLTSSVVMMTRLAIGAVPLWQITLSFAILIATVYFIVRGVSNLFSSQTLLSGEKFQIKTFFRTIFVGR